MEKVAFIRTEAPPSDECCKLCGIHNPKPHDDHQEGCPLISVTINMRQAMTYWRQGKDDGMWGRSYDTIWKHHKEYQIGYEMGNSRAE